MAHRRATVMVRDVFGSSAVEWFLIFTIATIIVTRVYLHLTGYPQIGGGELHIAHALWGGALMMVALLVGWMFVGSGARGTAILLGGIGFGLFLDEVGKFVTTDNNYFYDYAAEIMYVLVVLVLLVSRLVRDLHRPTAAEALANAAMIAADGVVHGITPTRRRKAEQLLEFAEGDSDLSTIAHVRGLLATGSDSPDRLLALRTRMRAAIPQFFRRPALVTFFGWLLLCGAVYNTVLGVLGRLAAQGVDVGRFDALLAHDVLATWILLGTGAVTIVLVLPALVARMSTRGHDSVWPLRALRMAALVFALFTALVDFATSGFGALIGLGLGLLAWAVFAYHLTERLQIASTKSGGRDPLER